MAGLSGYPACESNPHGAQTTNVEATKNMVNFLSDEQRIIYASTTYFYGKEGKTCDENSVVSPTGLYGITKYLAEKEIMNRENSIALRFATVFGNSIKMRVKLLVNDFCYRAVTDKNIVVFDGKAKRTFIHINDAINGYLFALDNFDKMKSNIYNVGNNDLNFSKIEIANMIKNEVKDCTIISCDERDYDSRDFTILFDKINKLGYKTEKSLEYGIKEMVRLFKFFVPNQNAC